MNQGQFNAICDLLRTIAAETHEARLVQLQIYALLQEQRVPEGTPAQTTQQTQRKQEIEAKRKALAK